MDLKIVLTRFLLVFIMAFVYGMYRQRSHKPIGFGTFILISIGTCGLSMAAQDLGLTISIPLLGAAVTGIGFLGAGALIKNSDKIFGFTTAASIWVFAVFGLIMGLGYFQEGFIMYGIIWIVILFDNYLEKNYLGSYRRKVTVISKSFVDKNDITTILLKYCDGFHLLNINIDKKEKRSTIVYLVEGLKRDIEALLKEFNKKDWCEKVDVE